MSETATARTTEQAPPTPPVESPEPADSPEPEKTTEREYHLFKVAQNNVYQMVATVSATSPQNALKTLGEKALTETEHVACTARSWYAPGKPTVVAKTVLKFGE